MTEAERLAAELDAVPENGADPQLIEEAAAELRRLDEVEGDYQRLLEKHNNLHTNYFNLQEEIESLLAEIRCLTRQNGEWQEKAAQAMAECEQLRADAARYRWLVARPLNGEDEFYISAQDSIQANADGWWALGGDMSKSEADAYIDAAMKETK